MEYSSYQFGILLAGVLGLLLGVTSGICFALSVYGVGTVALILSAAGWGLVRVVAGRTPPR
jgi:hypothetical protein